MRWVGFALLTACSGAAEAVPTERHSGPLIAGAWAPAAHLDPVPDHAPARVECDAGAVVVEARGSIDVDTGACNYVVLHDVTLLPIPAGRTLRVDLVHLDLFDPESTTSEGHAALAIDGQLVWEKYVSIPAAAHAYTEAVTVDFDVVAGADVVFHLHNHGANEWRLYGLSLAAD